MALALITLSPVETNTSTATRISNTAIYASSVIIHADALNTNKIYWGASNVTVSNGLPIAKNETQNITYDLVYGSNGKIDLSKIYLASDTNGNLARIAYFEWTGG